MIIDIILVAIIGVLGLVAAFFFPNKDPVASNDTKKYKSMRPLIFIAGIAAMGIGALLIVFYLTDEEYQNIFNMIKIPVFFALGATIIVKNISQSKKIAAMEGGMVPGMPVTGELQAIVQPQVAAQQIGIKGGQPQQVAAQQIGVKTVEPTVVQPQVATQQIGIKGAQTAPVQAQVVAAQPQPAPQPRIVVIKCPKCQGNMQINTAMLGQKMKCPHCGVEGKIG